MKIKNILFATTFLFAIGASFAFKAEKKLYKQCTYKDTLDPGLCNWGGFTEDYCNMVNTGAVCTTYDAYYQQDVPAYYQPSTPPGCEYPLYAPF